MELSFPAMQKNGKKPIIDGIKRVRKSGSRIQRDYKPFGRFIINRKELSNNVMLLKYEKSHGPIKDWHRHKVSDPIKRFVLNLIDTAELNTDLLKQIEEQDDIEYLEKLLNKCQISNQLKYKRYVFTVNDYVEKFNLIKGSISSGNNNPKLKAQLRELIELLSNPVIKKINKEDANFLNECLVEMEINN
jgi:hypothetical protein